MTKAELVEDVARAAELTKKDAERLVEIVFESIIETLNQGEKIELRGFGSFRVRERGARRGRSRPRPGAARTRSRPGGPSYAARTHEQRGPPEPRRRRAAR